MDDFGLRGGRPGGLLACAPRATMQRLVSMAMLALTSAAPQCTDTKDWLNQYGAGCEAYLADGHCNGQGFADGHMWTAGEEYGYPELHCCVCGKDIPEEEKGPCTDTPGWHNQYDSTCADYVKDARCAGKAIRKGNEWAFGAEWKFPEHNCCACGKPADVMPPPSPPSKPPPPPSPPPCFDTPGWSNQYGSSCAAYNEEGHCVAGGFAPAHEWTSGPEFGSPEHNCCICGKLPWPPPHPPPPPVAPHPPPPPPPSPPPPPPPLPPFPSPPPTVCRDECPFVKNGICQDGGHKSKGASCAYGTDCTDCGPRNLHPPLPPPLPLPPPPAPQPPIVRHSRPRPSPPLPPPPLPPPPPPPETPLILFGVTTVELPSSGAPAPGSSAAPTAATDANADKLQSVTAASGVLMRAGMSLASEGGAAIAAHASTAVQAAADQVVHSAGLTPEQGQLVGVLIGTSVGVLLLCCVRCWCSSGKRARRRGSRQQHARLVGSPGYADEAGYDSYDDADFTPRREPYW